MSSSKSYTSAEKTAISLRTANEFVKFWNQTRATKERFDKNHDTGLGRAARGVQSSAAAAGEFMHEFSPIINIVKDFGAPFGGIAVGVVSMFFTVSIFIFGFIHSPHMFAQVAMNKNETEERLESTLGAIMDRLPGFKMYQHIYNDDHEIDAMLQGRIVLAYQALISFCIAAIKYYKGSGPSE